VKCGGNNDEQVAMNAWVEWEREKKSDSMINVQGVYLKAKPLTKSSVTQSNESGNCRLLS